MTVWRIRLVKSAFAQILASLGLRQTANASTKITKKAHNLKIHRNQKAGPVIKLLGCLNYGKSHGE